MAHIIRRRHGTPTKSNLADNPPVERKDKIKLWKVIAPFVTAPKKVREKDDEQFSFYLRKKPEVLIQDLSSFMSDSVDLPSLFHETADVLNRVCKAAWSNLYLVDRVTNDIYLSKMDSPQKDRFKVRWQTDEVSTVATYVAKMKEYVLVDDIIFDHRFPEGLGYNDYSGAYIPKSVMCVPVITPDNECFAVFEFVRTINDPPFTQDHLRICVMVMAWMGIAIYQNQERLALRRQQELNDYLVELVKCFFEDHVLMEKLMMEVVKFAKVTLGAERGSFFILDQESDEMIAHLFEEEDEADTETKKCKKVRFSKERGIAGLVARTGITVNIKDAYKDSRFNKEIDQKTGFITRSILCMPIVASSGILGVVQVVNKKNGGCFTSADENLFKTFSLYCAIALHYTHVHTLTKKQRHLHVINLRMVQLQQVPCVHDFEYFMENPCVEMPKEFDSYKWYVDNADELKVAPQYVLYMLYQLIDKRDINVKIMMKFILTVRKSYRDIPYHNFEHAFNVCHCMYVTLKRNIWKFSKLEVKALLVACMCHDLDHVGLTNAFLQLTKHDLACLYRYSTLENHHWQNTKRLLDDHEIFNNFTSDTKKLFYEEIHTAIIATDLAVYFETRADLAPLVFSGALNWKNPSHRIKIKSIMMNACDLSGSCKPYLSAKRVTDNLYKEFYRQGDLEKKLGLCPLSVMDRDKQDFIPQDQIQFSNVIVIPCMEMVTKIVPNMKDLYDGAKLLRSTWQDIIDMRGKKVWRHDDSIVSTRL